jgi:hypothetical protein
LLGVGLAIVAALLLGFRAGIAVGHRSARRR